MDLQNIQNQLNTEFAKSETRIIFWFDDKDIDYINEKVLDTISNMLQRASESGIKCIQKRN